MNDIQKTAFEKFAKLKVGALFMKMGTGKTKVAIELVDYNNCGLLLYITPFATLKNIEKEFLKWNLKTPYLLKGYETISSSDRVYLELHKELENKKVFIIADESIFIKNEDTKRFNRLLQLRNKCEYALILNGTPLTKNEWDLYNQIFFLSPKIINMNRAEFQSTFFKKISYKKRGQREKSFYQFSEVNAEYLHKLIEPYIFQANLDLENKENEEYIYIEYSGEEYTEEKEKKLNEYLKYGDSHCIINMFQVLNVIAANYDKKNDELIKYVENKKIIVFCNFLKEVEYISKKIDCYVITGEVKNRDGIINQFENNNIPLIMTMGTGSFSLNLQFCNEIAYSSLAFDYAKIEQSKYRIKRIGQNKDIKYTYFLTDLGINKLIIENLERKETLSELIKEKIEGGDEWLKNL